MQPRRLPALSCAVYFREAVVQRDHMETLANGLIRMPVLWPRNGPVGVGMRMEESQILQQYYGRIVDNK